MKQSLYLLYIILVVVSFGSIVSATAGHSGNEHVQTLPKIAYAHRVEDNKIIIDGILDDAIWKNAALASDFLQYEPDEGKAATEKTTVQIAYDSRFLFVAVRAYDTEPHLIRGLLTRRDEDSPSDWIHFAVDSFGDNRTAFMFSVNPAGVKMDIYIYDDEQMDMSWDAVWDVGVEIDREGWTAEFQIPFNQLRFPKSESHSWGFQVSRSISRKNEIVMWKFMPRDEAGIVSNFGELRGINNIGALRRLHVLPYVLSSAEHIPVDPANPFTEGKELTSQFGADIKFGLNSYLTMDISINPDFGQVEADPSEFNLTAYETFFEEKRPFFVEGSNIFNFGIGLGDGDMANESLFYSRRIGRAPQYDPDLSDDGFMDMPKLTTILGAAKITGKTKNGWSVGMLNALTDKEMVEVEDYGERYKEVAEPRTNYTVLRTQKDFREGRTTLGVITTGVVRDIKAENIDYLNDRAFTGGIDFSHRFRDDTYSLQLKFVGSHIHGSREAIDDAQTSSARYYQRPDASHLQYDTTRTSLTGYGANYYVGKIGGGNWRWGIGGYLRSPGFEVNDIGFMRDADFLVTFAHGGYFCFKPGRIFRDYIISFSSWTVSNFGGVHTGKGVNLFSRGRFLNYWVTMLSCNAELDLVSTSMLRGGPAVKEPKRYNASFNVSTDSRKAIEVGLNGGIRGDKHGTISYRIMPQIILRPSGRFNASFMFGYLPSKNDRQYVDEIEDENGLHYVIGHLRQKTLFMTTRINYTVRPNLSLQFYGMPFLTAGKYSNFREAASTMAEKYEDRFAPFNYEDNPDFNFRQFRCNLVVRWEYLPGSTIYLVWSQGRTSLEEEQGVFALRNDSRALFDTEPENVFLVKINRWFDL